MTEQIIHVNTQITQINVTMGQAGPQGPQGPEGPAGGGTGGGVPTGGTTGQVLRKKTNTDYDTEFHTLVKADIGLDQVNNTADLDKPISNAVQAVFNSIQSILDAIVATIPALASRAETTAGTNSAKAVTPDGLAHSDYGKRGLQILVTDPNGGVVSTGDGKAIITIPSELNGYNLVAAHGSVTTVSSSGLPTFQVRRIRDAVADADMLSTKVSIDVSEKNSYLATTAPAIDAANDDVLTGDQIAVDVDIAGTGTKGLVALLTFQLP